MWSFEYLVWCAWASIHKRIWKQTDTLKCTLLLHCTNRVPALRRTDNCNNNKYMGERHVNSRVCPITVEVVLVILILLLMNSVCLKCYECLAIALLYFRCCCTFCFFCFFCFFFHFLAFHCNNVARMKSTCMQLYLYIQIYVYLCMCVYVYVCVYSHALTFIYLCLPFSLTEKCQVGSKRQ